MIEFIKSNPDALIKQIQTLLQGLGRQIQIPYGNQVGECNIYKGNVNYYHRSNSFTHFVQFHMYMSSKTMTITLRDERKVVYRREHGCFVMPAPFEEVGVYCFAHVRRSVDNHCPIKN